MSTAPGLRDQRLKLYARHDKGSDGIAAPVFVLSETRWGRVDETGSLVRQAQDRLQRKVDAAAEFSDEVTVPDNGVIVDELAPTTGWWVRGHYSVRQLRRVVVALERVSGDTFRAFTLRDSAHPLDGTHLVNTS